MASKKQRIVYLLICDCNNDGKQLYIDDKRFFDKKINVRNCFKNPQRCSKIFKDITSLIAAEEIKAMAFINHSFENSIKEETLVKEKFRKICQNHEIFCHFPQPEPAMINGILLGVKPNAKEGEYLAVFDSNPFKMMMCYIVKHVGDNEYSMINSYHFFLPELSNYKQKIQKEYSIEQCIFANYRNSFRCPEDVGKMFRDFKVSFLEETSHDSTARAIPKLIDFFMNGNKPEYLIKYISNTEFTVPSTSIICKNGDFLPFEKSLIQNIKKKRVITLRETKAGEIQRINLGPFRTQKVKITFKLDVDMFYDLKIEPYGPVIKESIEQVFKTKLSLQEHDKAKIVFTQIHCSIFVFINGKKKLIKNTDGLPMIPLVINFVEEQPFVGAVAEEIADEKPTFIIYDLMDLMKLCSTEIHKNKDPEWPFKITKDSKNEFLIEFDTFRGRRRKAPDFFIRMILKFCLGLIENETGKKFEELGIEFEGLGNKENFIECFQKAAKRINLGISFL